MFVCLKFCMLSFLVTCVLRFALFPYYRQIVAVITKRNPFYKYGAFLANHEHG